MVTGVTTKTTKSVGVTASESGTTNYTPKGNVTASFSGTDMTSTGEFTPEGTVAVGTTTATVTVAG